MLTPHSAPELVGGWVGVGRLVGRLAGLSFPSIGGLDWWLGETVGFPIYPREPRAQTPSSHQSKPIRGNAEPCSRPIIATYGHGSKPTPSEHPNPTTKKCRS